MFDDESSGWIPEPSQENPDDQATPILLDMDPGNYGVDNPPDHRITGWDHPVDKKHRFPNIPYQVSPVRRIVNGNPDSFPLTFRARSVFASNYTPQWAYIDAVDDWIPPFTVGWVRRIPQDTSEGRVYWGAPAGITQPAASATGILVLTWMEEELRPSPGVPILAVAGIATVVQGAKTPADATPNPTDAQDSESFGMVWNGATWDRVVEYSATALNSSVPTGIAAVGLTVQAGTGASGASSLRSVSGTGADAGSGNQSLSVGGIIFNGATWDRMREGQFVGSLLQSVQPSTAALSETSGTTAAGAQITASVAGVAAKTSFITGFDVDLGPGTAGAVTVAVTGITNTLNYVVATPTAGTGTKSVRFPVPIPATAVNTAIVVTVPASGGAAAVNTVNVYGFTN